MLFLEFPSTSIFSGPSRCGKTFLLTKILIQYQHKFSKIIWFNSDSSAIPEEIQTIPNVEVFTKVPENFNIFPEDTAIVLDDGMLDCDTKAVCDLYIKGCHHKK